MAGKIRLDRLLSDMLSHKLPWRDQDDDPIPETIALAQKALAYCRQEGIPTPVQSNATHDDPRYFISIDNFGTKQYGRWVSSDDAQEFWAKHTPIVFDEDEEGEDGKGPWSKPGTRAFQNVAVPAMAAQFIISEKDEGLFQMYRITNLQRQECVQVVGSPDDINTTILRALHPIIEREGLASTIRKANAARTAFLACAPAQAPPQLLGQPGEVGWCLHRATVIPDPAIAFPHIRSMLDRCNDGGAVAAFVYGVFSGRNRGRQVLWLHDQRGEGSKSTFLNAIGEGLFGNRIYAAFPGGSTDKMTDTHTSSAFVGKRLVIVGDCNNPYLLHTALFKSLSGDDPVHVNPKFVQPFTTTFEARAIVASNFAPFMISAAHNRSRTLYVTMAPLNITDAERDVHFGDKCKAELPGFLAYGRQEYERRCSNDYAIAVNDAVQRATQARINQCETQHAELFHEHFVADPEGVLTSKEWNQFVKTVKLDFHKAEDALNWIKAVCNTIEEVGPRKGTWELPRVRLRGSRDDYASEGETLAGAH